MKAATPDVAQVCRTHWDDFYSSVIELLEMQSKIAIAVLATTLDSVASRLGLRQTHWGFFTGEPLLSSVFLSYMHVLFFF